MKLAYDPVNQKKVAIKILKTDLSEKTLKLVLEEIKIMQGLVHENVLQQIEFGSGMYTNAAKPEKSKEVSYIVLNLASSGELFDFISASGPFTEPIARYYFKQALEGLDYCHSNGVAHRDLKPENLLLDKDFKLKIADFGFAGPMAGRDGSGYLQTKLGTSNYMAPEIHEEKAYNGAQVDLFALAIILFILVSGHPPFNTAEVTADPFYKAIAQNKSHSFWRVHSKNKPNGQNFFSEEFKALITMMLQYDPVHRPSISEIFMHPWMAGPMPTEAEALKEFQARHQEVIKA